MSIPKVIYQTFKSDRLPLVTRWHISRMRSRNPEYQYEFYDDVRIEEFLEKSYDEEVLNAYRRIQIGAVKADFFRYTVLYKKGGIYLDIDSRPVKRFRDFILPDDVAVISRENHPGEVYVQWALIFAAGHPFLKSTIDLMLDNISHNRHLHDAVALTGPVAYSNAIKNCLKEHPDTPYRLMGTDYEGALAFKYLFNKFLYKSNEHWKKAQQIKPILKPEENIE